MISPSRQQSKVMHSRFTLRLKILWGHRLISACSACGVDYFQVSAGVCDVLSLPICMCSLVFLLPKSVKYCAVDGPKRAPKTPVTWVIKPAWKRRGKKSKKIKNKIKSSFRVGIGKMIVLLLACFKCTGQWNVQWMALKSCSVLSKTDVNLATFYYDVCCRSCCSS